MKKAIVVVLMALVILAFSLGVFAFQNEPDGFRGLKWGDPLGVDMAYSMTIANTKLYTLRDDKMYLGDVSLYRIRYIFYEDRFMGVTLYFKGKENYGLLERICKERYGEEEVDEGFYELTLYGPKSFILVVYDVAEEEGYLAIVSTAISDEQIEAQKKKEAEKAAGDW